jgi:hypothetical protein
LDFAGAINRDHFCRITVYINKKHGAGMFVVDRQELIVIDKHYVLAVLLSFTQETKARQQLVLQ